VAQSGRSDTGGFHLVAFGRAVSLISIALTDMPGMSVFILEEE
jgi:hypothetical protein